MSSSENSRNKCLLAAIALAGIGAIVYGMRMQEDAVFIGGVVCTVAAYLLIRKKLRQAASSPPEIRKEEGND